MKTSKLFTIAIILLIAICFAGSANAFTVKLENTTNETLLFRFTWLDCDWEGFPKTTHMWAGEINAGQILRSDVDRVAGPYRMSWQSMGRNKGNVAETYSFIVPNGPGIVEAITGQPPEFTPGI